MSGNDFFSAKDERRFMLKLLRSRWEEDNKFKLEPTPFPAIVEAAGDGGQRARNMKDNPAVVYVRDGGDPTIEPASVGFRDRKLEQVIDVEIQTTSQVDMFGKDGETYGGYAGEVQRIVDSVRYGADSYDYIWYDTVSEQSEDYGADIWHVEWPVRFIAYSNTIGQQGVK